MKIKLSIIAFVTTLLGTLIPAQAQNYAKMWKEVEAMEKKDLPRSAQDLTDQIYNKAFDEKNAPEMMKAYIYRMHYRQEVSPDSFFIDLKGLARWADMARDAKESAILNSMLGDIYGELLLAYYNPYAYRRTNIVLPVSADDMNASSLIQKTLRHFRQSLRNPKALSEATAEAYQPVVIYGNSSSYFGNDLYHMLSLRAIETLRKTTHIAEQHYQQARRVEKYAYWDAADFGKATIRPVSDGDYKSEILKIYQNLFNTYSKANNSSALLMIELARLEYVRYEVLSSDGLRMINEQSSLADDPYYAQLAAMLPRYPKTEVAMELYIRMSEYARGKNKLITALQLANEGLSKYGRHKRANALKNMQSEILQPYFWANMSDCSYPGKELKLHANYRNLDGFTLRVYRLNLAADSPLLSDYKEKVFRKAHARLLTTQKLKLDATTDYLSKDTVISINAPEEGVYMVELDTEKKGIEPSRNLLYVSKISIINRRLPGDKYEFVVVDAQSGHPLPVAELMLYQNDDQKLKLHTTLKTDSTGTLVTPYNKEYTQLRATVEGDLYMKPMAVGYSYFREGRQQKDREVINLFTDRSIYRPGQTVHVAGIAYEQQKDSTDVIANKNYTVQLFDVNNQVIGERYMSTNEFGTFSGQFILPTAVLPGRFRIKVGETTSYIQVEEYKRPTFDVVFLPQEGSYSSGDKVEVKAYAKTFSGVPLRNTRVKYSVTRHAPLFWRWMGAPKTLMIGEAMTNTEGEFSVNVYLEPDEEYKTFASWYSTYTVEATVTDMAGETQSGSTHLQVGSSSLILSSDLPDVLLKEGSGSITFTAKNLNQVPVKLSGTYAVHLLTEQGGEKTVGGIIMGGSFVANEAFEPGKIRALPSGRYRIILSAADHQNRTVTYEKDFITFSGDDTRTPIKSANWFHEISNEFSENQSASLLFGTSSEEVYVFYDVFANDQHLINEQFLVTDTVYKLEFPYKEEYGDGILVQLTFLKDGEIYMNESRITKSKPEKQLNMKWEVFRDKLKPGQHEEWKLSVEYPDGEPAEAELLATLYDASLDKLQKHNWAMNLSFPRMLPYIKWNISSSYPIYYFFDFPYKTLDVPAKQFNNLISNPESGLLYGFMHPEGMYYKTMGNNGIRIRGTMDSEEQSGIVLEMSEAPALGDTRMFKAESATGAGAQEVNVRENFAETAFFYPQLKADEEGKIKFSFTMPESLTEWNFMGLSHTKKMDWGKITGKTVVSKEFMIAPNMPRFVRLGDFSSVAANVMNLSAQSLSGTVTLQLINPLTEKIIYSQDAGFHVGAGETGSVKFNFTITNEDIPMLVCRITARGGNFSDGEQHYIPVISHKMKITETVPIALNGKVTRSYSLDQLFNKNSRTASNQVLTLEYSGNPAWYAVQALPALSNPINDDAISWASAYFANTMASYIANSNPRIKSVFSAWKAQGGNSESLWSNLQKNPELKQMVLNETPWLMDAEREADQKSRIALLFDLNNIEHNNTIALRKLKETQLLDGAWPWYKGMNGSRYVTQFVIEALTKLQQTTQLSLDSETQEMYDNAFKYLDAQVAREYQQILSLEKGKIQFLQVSELTVQYLYLYALSGRTVPDEVKSAHNYFIGRLYQSISQLSIYGKAISAIILYKNGKVSEAEDFVTSLQQYAVMTKDMGLYYDGNASNYSWYNYRVPAHVAVMEATELVSKNTKFVEEMKVWLLKQKQARFWTSTPANMNAIYALLTKGENLLNNRGSARITLGNKVIDVTPANSIVPEMGYVKRTYSGADLSSISSVEVTTRENGLAWGAIYAQYDEEIDKVTPINNIFTITKRLYVERIVGNNAQLVPLNDGMDVAVGDRIVSRLTIRTDRDVDFVYVKDQRAACLEPFITTSGFKGQSGVGYYMAVKDASTEFFFDTLRKGSYAIEQSYYVARAGEYSSGVALIQSAYAPEFVANSDAIRVKVD